MNLMLNKELFWLEFIPMGIFAEKIKQELEKISEIKVKLCEVKINKKIN